MRRYYSAKKSIDIELFPFLSILACTIGTLILLIIVLTTQVFSNELEITIDVTTEQGQNKQKIPRYIECRSDGIVLYPSETFVPQHRLNVPYGELNQFLTEIRNNRDKAYLIVAVRPDGIETFQEVRNLVEQQGIDIGYEPIDKGWKLKIDSQ